MHASYNFSSLYATEEHVASSLLIPEAIVIQGSEVGHSVYTRHSGSWSSWAGLSCVAVGFQGAAPESVVVPTVLGLEPGAHQHVQLMGDHFERKRELSRVLHSYGRDPGGVRVLDLMFAAFSVREEELKSSTSEVKDPA